MRNIRYCFIILLGLLTACSNDDGGGGVESAVLAGDILVVNEGNFGFGNASLSLYNSRDESVVQKIFQQQNSGRPIGDVVQSAIQIEDKLFIVVNNSNKIEVLDRFTFEFIGDVQGLNSPRYILPISANTAYVSDLFEDKIYRLDLENLTVISTIETGGWTEEMLLVNNTAFVCHVDSNQVWVINTISNQIIRKIDVNEQPQHIEQDKNGNLWVSCSGGLNGGVAALYEINPISFEVERILSPSDSTKNLSEIEFNSAKDQLYYLSSGDLFRFPIEDSVLSQTPFVSGSGSLFYGLAVDDRNDEIYLIDAIDFLQRGVVLRYNTRAERLSFFKAGIIPGDLLFLN